MSTADPGAAMLNREPTSGDRHRLWDAVAAWVAEHGIAGPEGIELDTAEEHPCWDLAVLVCQIVDRRGEEGTHGAPG